MPGIGKTTLVSQFAMSTMAEMPVFWHQLSQIDSFQYLVTKIAVFLNTLGDRELLSLIDRADLVPYLQLCPDSEPDQLPYVVDEYLQPGFPPLDTASLAFSLHEFALSPQTIPILPWTLFRSILNFGESCLSADVRVQE